MDRNNFFAFENLDPTKIRTSSSLQDHIALHPHPTSKYEKKQTSRRGVWPQDQQADDHFI